MKLRFGLLLISVLAHAMIFIVLPRFRAPLSSSPALVELVETPMAESELAAPTHKPTQARRSATRGTPSSRSESKLRDATNLSAHDSTESSGAADADLVFAPSFRPHVSDAADSVGSSGATAKEPAPKFDGDGVPTDDPTSAWGSGGAEFARVRDLGKFDRLYDLIDANVLYPGVLAYHQVQGTVNARLILTPQGRCDWHHSTIDSTQAHLKLYVLDVLKHVCQRDLKKFARKDQNANLDLSFKFAITEHNDERLIASEKKVIGNVFLFYRNSQASIAEWHLGPFRGMFPVPMIAIDFAWLQENYDKVMHSRDPMSEFRDHMTNDMSDLQDHRPNGES